MKRTSIFLIVLAAIAVFGSCSKNNEAYYRATATLKSQEGGTFFLEVNDSTALVPVNVKQNPYPQFKERRCLLVYTYSKQASKISIPGYKYAEYINLDAIDTVRTKNLVPHTDDDDVTYGNAYTGLYLPISGYFPYSDIEDGYLCVSFAFRTLLIGKTHVFNVVKGVDPENPYLLELRHESKGDDTGALVAGYFAFPLKDLPPTGGKTVTLTLRWNSMNSFEKKEYSMPYCSRTDWPE